MASDHAFDRHDEKKFSLIRRYWIYQKERFPLVKHGLLIATFSSSAVCLSALLRHKDAFPSFLALSVSFFILITLFLQLRIADEFKDAEDDARARPERPVPRGLVSLRELAYVAAAAGVFQLATVLLFHPPLIFFLVAVLLYIVLMSVEFFVPVWLKTKPALYMISHMLVMPLIDLLATATDWLKQGAAVPEGLFWFLVISFFNGLILEVGRKTWAPSMEIEGAESYSSAWGLRNALIVWSAATGASFLCALAVAQETGFTGLVAPVFGIVGVFMFWTAYQFGTKPEEKNAKRLETMSGLWILFIYLFLGVIPMGIHAWL